MSKEVPGPTAATQPEYDLTLTTESERPTRVRRPWPYRTSTRLAAVTVALLLLGVALGPVISELLQLTYRHHALSGNLYISLCEVCGGAYVLVCLLTAFVFLRWFHRCYANLRALEAVDLKARPIWTMLWFFVPYLSVFRPCQLMVELWRASDPTVGATNLALRERMPRPVLVITWWWLWQCAALTLFCDQVQNAPAAIRAVETLVSIATSLFAVAMVREITRRQELKFAQLRG